MTHTKKANAVCVKLAGGNNGSNNSPQYRLKNLPRYLTDT